MKRRLFSLFIYVALLASFSTMATGAEIDFTANGTFIVPDGVTEITVHVWGAGGGGGGAKDTGKAGGGGGGGYAIKVISGLLGGESFAVTVGIGGSGGTADPVGSGSPGGTSSFGAQVDAAGGNGGGGSGSDAVPGLGGSGGAGITGTVLYSGGDGAAGVTVVRSGGGGGAAGTTVNGGSAINENGGTGGLSDVGLPAGGDGGNGLLGVEGNGSPGNHPGGGGGGAYSASVSGFSGGAGAGGLVKVVSVDPLIGITKTQDLSFGSFVVNGAGTVTIPSDPVGVRSSSGDIVLVGSNAGNCAIFTVKGASKHFSVTFDITPANITSGVNNIPVTFSVGYENQNSAADTEVYIGGQLTPAGVAPAGTYSAAATISVAYD